MEIKLNKHGINSNIKANVFSDEAMRMLGFTDFNKDNWHFSRDLGRDIIFSVSINKNDVDDLNICILDDNFMQHYDYQHMLSESPDFKPALEVKEKVEKWMKYLQENGVLSGHEYGEYI